MPVSSGWSAHRLHSNLGSWVRFARQFGLVARRLLGHALATKSRPLTVLMKICPCTAQKLPGCTHVLPKDNAAIRIRRNHWTSKRNCAIMELIYVPTRITVHLTVQGISRYACCDSRDAGITVQLTVRSPRITYAMKTLLLDGNPSRGIIMQQRKNRRNHWTSKRNCNIMEVMFFPTRITVHLTVQGISRYACYDYRDAGITVQLTVRSPRIMNAMQTLLLDCNPFRRIIILLISHE